MIRLAIVPFLAILVAGCGSSGAEEAQAYKELEVKPQTEAQKKAIESITKNPPPGGGPSGASK